MNTDVSHPLTVAEVAEYRRRDAVADGLHAILTSTDVQLAGGLEDPDVEINLHREPGILKIEIEAKDVLLLDERRPQPMAMQLADALRLGAVALRDRAAALDRMGAAIDQHAEKAEPAAVANETAGA